MVPKARQAKMVSADDLDSLTPEPVIFAHFHGRRNYPMQFGAPSPALYFIPE
jgi:hypothetical protein